MSGGWSDPLTAQAYRAFERRHGRYRRANEALARHAALNAARYPDLRVLDLAAGTGGTTAALLPMLGPQARVDCVEPAKAMAAVGRERLGPDPRVHWHRSLQALGSAARFDRIVCGAAIWQWPKLPALFRTLARRLVPGGALVFDIPAAYLGEPDGPGGGADPCLIDLLVHALRRHPAAPTALPAGDPRTAADIDAALLAAGLVARRWSHRQRLTQAAWRDWLCLPPLSTHLWPGVEAAERVRRIHEAARDADHASWRPERWLGWTAWKPAFKVALLADASTWVTRPWALRRRAARDGVLLLRQCVPRHQIVRLRSLLAREARAEGLLDRRGRWVGGTAPAPHEIARWIELQQRMGLQRELQQIIIAPALADVVQRLLGGAVRSGLGSVCRIAPPDHLVAATPPHRDAEFLRESQGVWSAWLPLQPCAVADGVLAVAPRSHRSPAAPRWAAAELFPGDVLLLSAQTLHRACPNQRLFEPRLSIDLRFGPA